MEEYHTNEIQSLHQKDDIEDVLAASRIKAEIITSISKLFMQVYRVDLEKNEYNEVTTEGERYGMVGKAGILGEMYNIGVNMLPSEEYRDTMKQFLDFSTLADRLAGKTMITEEIQGFNGRWYSVYFIENHRDDNGRLTHALYVIRDVDRRKQKELRYKEQLVESAQEAERANAAKTDFLRHMSHDIRTPINGIQGMLQMAERHKDEPEVLTECLQKAFGATQYLLSLVNNVLDMSKLESGGIVLENKPFNLISLLMKSSGVVQTQAAEAGISFHGGREMSSFTHYHLIGSPIHLNRVLMNISTNAVKYSRKGGNVTMYCTELSSDEDTAVMKFTCEDDGVGMSSEFLAHAFEPFAQEGRKQTSRYVGSGLGLSIVKEIITLMGGHIEINSEVNKGTRIEMTIPFKIDKNPQPDKYEVPDKLDIKGKRALLVEDNELNMEIARMLLEDEGLIVTTAANGQAAVDMFQSSEPYSWDYIFMDIMMPVMDGLEATRTIRTMDREDARTIPIIAMSANAFQDDIEHSLEAGMDAYITKPLEAGRIRQTIAVLSDR